jgi:hypothetical protein
MYRVTPKATSFDIESTISGAADGLGSFWRYKAYLYKVLFLVVDLQGCRMSYGRVMPKYQFDNHHDHTSNEMLLGECIDTYSHGSKPRL